MRIMHTSRKVSRKASKPKKKNLAKLESATPPPPPADDASKEVTARAAESATPSCAAADTSVTEGWTAAAQPPSPSSILDDLVAAQQRYVLLPPTPGGTLPTCTSLLLGLPSWSDATSARQTQQSGHLPYIIDELVCLPSKEERPGRFKWWLVTKIAWSMAFYTYLAFCAYRSAVIGLQDWCAMRNLVLIVGVLLTVLPFLSDVLSDILDGYPDFREKLDHLQIAFAADPVWRMAAAGCLGHLLRVTRGQLRRMLPFSATILMFCTATLLSRDPAGISVGRVSRGVVVWYVSAVALLEWKTSAPFVSCLGSQMLAALQMAPWGLEFLFGSFVVGTNFTQVLRNTSFAGLGELDVQAPFLFRILPRFFLVTFWINFAYCIPPLRATIVNLVRTFKFFTGATMTETMSALANMFVPMAESTLMVHPYMAVMTPSEVFTVITCGFATLSASTLPELVDAGIDLNDVVTSGILGSLGSLCLSKIYLPEVDKVKVKKGHFSINKSLQLQFVDVLGNGMVVSLTMAGCMTGCLIAFVTFFAFADGMVNWVGEAAGLQGLGADRCEPGTSKSRMTCALSARQSILERKRRTQTVATMSMCCSVSVASSGLALAVLQLLSPGRTDELSKLVAPAMLTAFGVNVVNCCLACILLDDDTIQGHRFFGRTGSSFDQLP
ncbi:uncharacterized transporter YutK-like isoform X2 [Dermacentor albipictus]|uniref:uncharacterized transporter YutK-like isoform X2 n=1 Tax=Dermacentor albipictus TaxID=60249 RepID=UPI0038FCF09D